MLTENLLNITICTDTFLDARQNQKVTFSGLDRGSAPHVTEVTAQCSKCLTRSFCCLPSNLGSKSSKKLTKFLRPRVKTTCLSCDINRHKSINAVFSTVLGKKALKSKNKMETNCSMRMDINEI